MPRSRKTSPKSEELPPEEKTSTLRERAHEVDGTFAADDPTTPKNEAWVELAPEPEPEPEHVPDTPAPPEPGAIQWVWTTDSEGLLLTVQFLHEGDQTQWGQTAKLRSDVGKAWPCPTPTGEGIVDLSALSLRGGPGIIDLQSLTALMSSWA